MRLVLAKPKHTSKRGTSDKPLVAAEGGAMLISNVRRMDEMLQRVLLRREITCHIRPIHVGPSDLTMRMSEACLDQGLFVHGIRFPSVREGASRLRLTVMSDHTTEDLRKASRIIETLFTARVNC